MIFILDSNFFIETQRFHLPLQDKPEFWKFLSELATSKNIIVPSQVCDEVCRGTDILSEWMKKRKDILVDPNSAFASIPTVLNEGYGFNNEDDLENINADPFVIALALELGGTVVTSEKPRPNAAVRNKKIPDVCRKLNIPCISITAFLWEILVNRNL